MQRREFLRNLGLAVPGLAVAGWQPLIQTVWAAEAPIDLIKDGVARCAIVIGKNAAPPERHAAEELRTYFKKVVGADIPIVAEGAATSTQFPLYLGTLASCPAIEKFGLRTKVSGLSDEGFLRRVDKRGLAITAKTPIGVLYGTYAFIEDSLSVHWLMPGEDGEFFQKRSSITVQPMENIQNPVFTHRTFNIVCTNINAPLNDTWDWMVRNKMQVNSGYKPFWKGTPGAEKMEEIGARLFGIGSLGSFVPNAMFEAHPEYFALVNGVRHRSDDSGNPEGHVYQRCTSNPAVIELGVQYIKNFFREKPEGDAFLIANNDGNGWCECDNCRALDDPWEREHGIVSTRFYKYINTVAQRVWEEFPNKKIESWGYQLFRKAPRGVIPDPKLYIGVAMHGRCFRHSWGDPQCPTNVALAGILKDWLKFKSSIGVYEYYSQVFSGAMVNNFVYVPYEDIVARDIKYVALSGGKGWLDEVTPPDGVYGPSYNERHVREDMRARFPMHYVAAKLLWNPNLDVEKLKDEAYFGYFGAAGAVIKSYRKLLIDAWQETEGHVIYGAPVIGSMGKCLAKPGLEQQLLGYLDTAAKAVTGNLQLEKRVAQEKEYFTEVWIKNARAFESSTAFNDVNVKRRQDAIQIDGNLSETDWLTATTTTGFTKISGKELAKAQTFVKILYDDEFIYFGIEMMDPSPQTLKTTHTERDGELWEDDDIEIFLDPDKSGGQFYHFAINPHGAVYDSNVVGGVEDKSFNANYQVATKVLEDRWIVELRIPFASLKTQVSKGKSWKVNIARSRQGIKPVEYSSWTDGGFGQPSSFRTVIFGAEPAALQNGGFETIQELKTDADKKRYLQNWESGSDPVLFPIGWALHESHPGKITMVHDDVHSGKNACKVEKGWIFNMFSAATGEKLNVEFWAKGESSVQMMLFQYKVSPEGSLKNVPTATLGTVQLTDTWTKYSFDQMITTPNVGHVALAFAVPGTLILDDVSVAKVSQ